MIFDFQKEVLENITLEGNPIFPVVSYAELNRQISNFGRRSLSPKDFLSLSVFRYLVLLFYAIIALVLIFGVYWSILFFGKVMWFIHDSKTGFPVYVRDPQTDTVQEVILKPFIWLDIKCLMLLQRMSFMFDAPPAQQDPNNPAQ